MADDENRRSWTQNRRFEFIEWIHSEKFFSVPVFRERNRRRFRCNFEGVSRAVANRSIAFAFAKW